MKCLKTKTYLLSFLALAAAEQSSACSSGTRPGPDLSHDPVAGRPGAGGPRSERDGSDGDTAVPDAGPQAPDSPFSPATADAPPPDGTTPHTATRCDYTPRANATNVNLTFDPIALPGIPIDDMAKSNSGPSVKDGITLVKFIPGAPDEFYIVQKLGRVTHMKLDAPGGKSATLIRSFDVPGVDPIADCGLLAMTFDPDFAGNKYVYFGFCAGPRTSKLMRFTLENDTLGDGVEVMIWDGIGGKNAWHSVGSAGFDSRGNLWMVHGEFNNALRGQDLSTNLGKMIRIYPSREPGLGGYTIPADNPFATDANSKTAAIYAYGFRSPWRAVMESGDKLIVGDVGDTTNEEVNIVRTKGQDFGWGTNSGLCSGTCTSPVTYWRGPHDPYDGEGDLKLEAARARAVWVGAQYGDCGNDRYGGALTGVVTFGDFFAGWVRGLLVDDAGEIVKDQSLMAEGRGMGSISSMDQSADGFLYATTFGVYGGDLAGAKPALFRVVPLP
jgi:glucose/arabinose dehydrogenase